MFLRRILAPVVAALLVFINLMPTEVTAQSGSRPLADSGEEIAWSSTWTLDDGQSQASSSEDVVMLSSEDAVLVFSTLPGNIDLIQARDIVLDGFAAETDAYLEIDRGAYGTVAYALDLAALGGVRYGAFTVLSGSGGDFTIVTVFLAPVETFAERFESSQSDVTLGDSGLFTGVDGAGLASLLDDRAAELDIPESEQTPAPPFSGAEMREAELDPELDALGVVAQGEYESPQYGTTVGWDTSFALDLTASAPAASDAAAAIDTLRLIWTGEQTVLVTILVQAANATTPEDVITYWTSDEYLGATASGDATVVVSEAAGEMGGVVIRDTLADGTEVVIVREVRFSANGDALTIFTFLANADDAAEAYTAAQTGITIDSESAFRSFTVEEVTRASSSG